MKYNFLVLAAIFYDVKLFGGSLNYPETDGTTYTMPVLYGHNGAVDNTQTPKIYAFNTFEILMFSSRCSLGKGGGGGGGGGGVDCDLKHTMHYEFMYKGKQNAVCPKVTSTPPPYQPLTNT